MEHSTEITLINQPNFRVKVSVDNNGQYRFTVHERSVDHKNWCYTTYGIRDTDVFAVRSGIYPGNWKSK